MIGIYKITNKNDGKVYIGQASNIERRISEHKQARQQTIDNYINCLGVENFSFEILEECSIEELDVKEQEYIEKYDSQNNGYNIQQGGFNNSKGSGNGRAKLTEKDVIMIRTAYANHEKPLDVFEKVKNTGISYASFQAAWQGQSWSYVMPEVFTEENKKYYLKGLHHFREVITLDELLEYRKYYINHTRKEVYEKFLKEKGEGLLKQRTFERILTGDVRKESIYLTVPLYKKQQKKWFLNGEPVSTIPGSGE